MCLTPHENGNSGLLERYEGFFRQASDDQVRVEKTTNYFENHQARERIADLLPDVKLIFLLREPVARAYSNWLWSRKNGLETLSFAEAISLEGNRPSPFSPDRPHVRPFDYQARGRYGTLAEAWLASFGRDQIAFYLFEAARDAPEQFVEEVQRFIGVNPWPWDKLQTGIINATEPDQSGLDPKLEAQLRERFAPEVTQLAKLTGLDVSAWGYD